MTTETTFTEREFLTQVGYFRELMGKKEFMEGPEETRDIAIRALQFAYTRVVGSKEEKDMCATMMISTFTEYGQRQAYIMTAPLRKMLGLAKHNG